MALTVLLGGARSGKSWLAVRLARSGDRPVTFVATAATRDGVVIAVSNEVGSGIVPMTALGRRFQDLLGEVNAAWVDAADRAGLMVAGRVLWPPQPMTEES